MIKIGFWNLAKNGIEHYVSDFILENHLDICILAEYNNIDFQKLIAEINNNYNILDGYGGCDKITLIAHKKCNIEIKREQNRYTIYSISFDDDIYIIAGIHLQDRLHSDPEARKKTIRDLVKDIEEQEKILKCDKTIVIGDYNASPFDDELIQKDAFNSVLFKELITKQEYVNFDGTRYRRFYNPMLNCISEETTTYGSLYYSSGIKTLYWYFYDQVVVRKSLINRIINISLIKVIKGKKLIKDVSPDKNISDHLPLLFILERRIKNA